jgi:hypothetical protein
MRSAVLFLTACLACNAGAGQLAIPAPSLRRPETDELDSWYLRQADSLRVLNPEAEAAVAVARGDLHLYGVMGFALIVPGREDDWITYPFGVYKFPATSEFIQSDAQGRYQEAAFAFATRYNRVVLTAGPTAGP